MAVNVEVTKGTNENTNAVLRKFTQRMRSSGIVQRMRKIRYRSRKPSKLVQRQSALRKLDRREDIERQVKEGKLAANPRDRRRR